MYIPACPMTPSNVRYLSRQREAARAFSPPPDFPGAGGPGELGFQGQLKWGSVSSGGLQAMGMGSVPWQVTEGMSEGERSVIEKANERCFR
jgi:hypothetical protein